MVWTSTRLPRSCARRGLRSASNCCRGRTGPVRCEGWRRIVVDVDLEKFFDRVDHDILIDRLQKRIGDGGVIQLIRAYLNSGIMDDGVGQRRTMGTPQGGPFTPLTQKVTSPSIA